MREFSLDHLQTFVDVVERGGFSAAAAAIGISQPAVSLQVRQLEARLGVRLLERIGRRVQPTPAGRELLLHAQSIQDEVARALEAVAPFRDDRAGRVRIGTGATACIHLLPPVLRAIRERMPGLEITVRTGNTADVLRLLEANAIDLAVVTLPAPGRAFAVEEIRRDELLAVFPATEAATPARATPAFLAGRPLLLYEGGGNTRGIIDRWFARAGLAPRPAMELGSVETIKHLVGAGLGWAVLPALAVDLPGPPPGIGTRPLSPRLWRPLGLALRRDKRLGRALRAVCAALRGGAENAGPAPPG